MSRQGLVRRGRHPACVRLAYPLRRGHIRDGHALTNHVITRTGRRSRLVVLVLVLLAAVPIAAACSAQDCPAGLHPYQNKCLTNMAIQYVGCTDGRGVNVTTELGAGGTLKEVAEVSLNVAYKQAKDENTPVALQIVKDCLEIARTTSPPDDPEQAAAAEFQRETINATPSISISPTTAKKGAQVTVTGLKFWPTEMVDIYLHATLVAQIQADATGSISTSITVPSSAPPPDFPTTITATGRSSAKSAMAPFQTAP